MNRSSNIRTWEAKVLSIFIYWYKYKYYIYIHIYVIYVYIWYICPFYAYIFVTIQCNVFINTVLKFLSHVVQCFKLTFQCNILPYIHFTEASFESIIFFPNFLCIRAELVVTPRKPSFWKFIFTKVKPWYKRNMWFSSHKSIF